MQEKYIFQTVPEHEKYRLSRAFVDVAWLCSRVEPQKEREKKASIRCLCECLTWLEPAIQSTSSPSVSPSSQRSDEGLTLETSAFRISVRWPIYIINSVDKTKFLYTTSPPTQHHSFFRNYPFIHLTSIWSNLSPLYDHVTLVSGYLVLTGVN